MCSSDLVLPDMSARVAFLSKALDPAAQRARTAVPQKAIAKRDGKELVFRLDGEQVVAVTLAAGANLGELREVGDALKPGDKIVLNPAADLQDGARVRTSAVAK